MKYAFTLALLGFRALQAVEVTPNSLCSALCMTEPNDDPADKYSSFTVITDVVCHDWELTGANSTIVGRKFNQCLICESNSTASDENSGENDVYWFLCKVSREDSSMFRR